MERSDRMGNVVQDYINAVRNITSGLPGRKINRKKKKKKKKRRS